MMQWLKKQMLGRYGVDQFSLFLLFISIILYLLALPLHSLIIRLLSTMIIIFSYYRILSKNVYKRQQENFKFIRFYTPILKKGRVKLRQIKEFKTHKFLKCPNCHQTLRIPRHKGNLSVTCPKCKKVFHSHS